MGEILSEGVFFLIFMYLFPVNAVTDQCINGVSIFFGSHFCTASAKLSIGDAKAKDNR